VASAILRIRLLGDLDIRLGETPLPGLESTRAESLLGYLLLHRGAPQPRQRIAFLLWPDSTEAQARTNLRHVLHNLRRGLPEADRFLEVSARTLRWRPDAPYWLDVAVFEQALAEGRLQDAVDAYTGDLIEGSYDDWLLEERERLRELQADALEQLVRQLEQGDEKAGAIRHAERLVRHDPLREETYRLLMRLHDAAGDRARALRAYHVCAATLARELGIEPSAATRAAYDALLPVAREPRSEERRSPSPARPPLIGRAAERARLTALWRTSAQGSGQFVLVTGEPGIGKSRLVEELRSWCAHAGALTAEARSYPAEGAVAYGPVVAWLRSDAIAARLRRLERTQLTELARLLPELVTELPDLPRPEPLPEDEQRQRLFDALAGALLASGAPLLLVADDLQWCDVATLQFLHYLLRAETGARLLVAATARREEVDARHPVSELVAGLQGLERYSEIELARLSREETGLLAEKLAGQPLPAADAERLCADSEGNPLFVVEALRGAPEAGATPRSGTGAKVHAVIADRLARLSEPASDLVGVAATIGREFTSQVLADASGGDEQAFVRGLDELWRRGIVRADGPPNAYDFSHGKIREAAYLALSPAQRRHNHLRVARALERTHAADLGAASGLLAAQYEAAGAAEEAITWNLRAADAAQLLHAYASAVGSLERALGLTRGLPASSERDAREMTILTALPTSLMAVEGYMSQRIVAAHERALGLADGLGVEPEAPLVRSLALASLTRGEFDAARAFGEQLRGRAERDADDVLWVESAYVLGVAAYWSGELSAARTHFEAAIGRYRPEHRATHLLRYGQDPESVCTMRLAHTLWLLGHDEDAARMRDSTLALANASDHPYNRAIATVWAAIAALDQRDEEVMREQARILASAAPGYEATQIRRAAEGFAGLVEVLDGQARAGVARAGRVLDEVEDHAPAAPGERAMTARVLLEACWAAGDAKTGLAVADRALTMRGARLWEAEIRRLRGEFLAALGAPAAEVEAELERALAVAKRQGAQSPARRARHSLDRFRAERPGERSGNGGSSTMPIETDEEERDDTR
jgi:DNA-binding SARP family transcriptional activator